MGDFRLILERRLGFRVGLLVLDLAQTQQLPPLPLLPNLLGKWLGFKVGLLVSDLAPIQQLPPLPLLPL